MNGQAAKTKNRARIEWAGTPEGVAVVTAALADAFAERSLVLAAAEVDEARWRELSVACQRALAADSEGRALYAARYTATMAALAAGEAPEKLVGDARAAWRESSAPTACEVVASERPVAVAAPVPHVQEEQRASPWAPAVERIFPRPQVPSVASAPVTLPAGMPVRGPSDLDATGATYLVLEPVLPFASPLTAPQHDAAERPMVHAKAAPSSSLDETSFVGVLVPATALPFVEGAAAPPVPNSSPLPPHEAAGETGFFTGIVIDDPLPFKAADELAHSAPEQEANLDSAAPALAPTEALDPALLDPGAHRFRSAPLTLRQLAAVLGEIRLHPDRRANVLAQYRLTEELAKALDAELRNYLAAGAWARAAWARVGAEYDVWRRGHSGG